VPNRRMVEILWHRRETRRQTENTNFCLNDGKAPAYSPAQFCFDSIAIPECAANRDRARIGSG